MASTSKRIGAYIVDFIIVFILSEILLMCIPLSTKAQQIQNNYTDYINETFNSIVNGDSVSNNEQEELVNYSYEYSKETLPSSIVVIILYFIYYVVLQFICSGQTIGKKIFKIKIIKQNDDDVDFKSMLIRSLFIYTIVYNILDLMFLYILSKSTYIGISYGLTYIKFILYMICLIMIIKNNGIGLHDKVANTKVIDVELETHENENSASKWKNDKDKNKKIKENPRLKNHTRTKEKD